MSDIKALRKKYGLSQAQLAFYLSVSLSMVKMVELGNRTLPTAALLKLNELWQTAAKQELLKKTGRKMQQQAAPLKDKRAVLVINQAIEQLTIAISKLEKRFSAAATLQEKGSNKIDLVQMLAKTAKPKKQESSWLRLLELEAGAVHNSYSNTKLQMLRIKLDCLHLEKDRLQELLSTLV